MATLGETAPEFVTIPEHLRSRVFLTYAEFGGITGKSAATIAYWARSGYIRVARSGPRSPMVPVTEVERWKNGEIEFTKPKKAEAGQE